MKMLQVGLILLFALTTANILFSQFNSFQLPLSVRSDGAAPDISAMVDIQSTNKGVLIPRMTSAQRLAINGGNPVTGLLVYDNTTKGFWFYDGASWVDLTAPTEITDSDKDTRVEVEQTPDEDSIRFTTKGIEHFVMDDGGRIHVRNTGSSVFMGQNAGLLDDASNNQNIAIGHESLKNNIGGFSNSAYGYQSLHSNNSGNNNTALGHQALFTNTGGSENTANGHSALYSNTFGLNNTATGEQAMYSNLSGNNNSAFGVSALTFNTTGNNNVALGNRAIFSGTTGSSNVAIGVRALYNNTDRSNLVAVGDSALYHNGDGAVVNFHATNNTAVGSKALYDNTKGFFNTAIGTNALMANTEGARNTAVGASALDANTTGEFNTAMGFLASRDNTTGDFNTAIGAASLLFNTTGRLNTGVGYDALYKNVEGSLNTAIGYRALYETEASKNTAVGSSALRENTTGKSNVAIGEQALKENTDRSFLVAIGDSALYNNGIGVAVHFQAIQNTAVGSKALFGNTTGSSSTAIGYEALTATTTGPRNTAIGSRVLFSNTSGFLNTASGYNALYSNEDGSGNTAIGSFAGYDNISGDDNVFIGHGSGHNETGSNKLYIDNSNTASPLIYGDFATDQIQVNGILSVNNSGTDARLVVKATEVDEHGLRVRINNTTKLLVHNNGGLKIGSNGTPPSDGIEIDGDAEKPGGGSWTSSSDRRLKDHIIDYTDGLELVSKIRPVKYYYKKKSGLPSDIEYIGVIAQELQKVAPYMVYEAPDEEGNNYLKVDFSAATYMLINATKTQQELIEKMESNIEKLLFQNDKLTDQIEKQQLEIEKLVVGQLN